jgi:hypothetical protein
MRRSSRGLSLTLTLISGVDYFLKLRGTINEPAA